MAFESDSRSMAATLRKTAPPYWCPTFTAPNKSSRRMGSRSGIGASMSTTARSCKSFSSSRRTGSATTFINPCELDRIAISLAVDVFLQYREDMRKGDYLGNFDLMLLLALMRLGDDAYGVTIARELEEQTERE